MAKFYGVIGYAQTLETKPGVWTESITERYYYGDLTSLNSRYQTAEKLNDDITVSNVLSIVADPFAYENFQHIRYVEFMGTKWRVTNIDANNYPRLILSLGGVYNGKTA